MCDFYYITKRICWLSFVISLIPSSRKGYILYSEIIGHYNMHTLV